MRAPVVKGKQPSLFGPSAPEEDLHLDISLARVDGADHPGDGPSLQAADPDVDLVAISRPKAGDIPIVERVDELGNLRMGAPLRTIDHDGRSRDE